MTALADPGVVQLSSWSAWEGLEVVEAWLVMEGLQSWNTALPEGRKMVEGELVVGVVAEGGEHLVLVAVEGQSQR